MISYVTGDATAPQQDPDRHAVIVHVCNNRGAWGKGFVTAITRRWAQPEQQYRAWAQHPQFGLGEVQIIQVSPRIAIANMVAQDGFSTPGNPAIRYQPLELCLRKVGFYCGDGEQAGIWADVHMPRIGCGLGGGEWSQVEPIIARTLVAAGINVKVYDL